jgi:hypothetical protein
MIAPRSCLALVLLTLVGVSSPTMAAGPLDGAYSVTGGAEGAASVAMFLVVLQTGSTAVVAVLDPLDSSWTFGSGTLNADQEVDGLLLFGDVLEAGQFRLRFQDSNVTGTIKLFETSLEINGTKVF